MDLIDQTRGGHADAIDLLKKRQEIAAVNLCAWHTLSTLSYLCAEKFEKASANEIIRELLKVFEIPTTGTKEAQHAFTYHVTDYEDALQVSSAVAGYADIIVTRDPKGFRQSPVTVLSPKKILSVLVER